MAARGSNPVRAFGGALHLLLFPKRKSDIGIRIAACAVLVGSLEKNVEFAKPYTGRE